MTVGNLINVLQVEDNVQTQKQKQKKCFLFVILIPMLKG